MSTGLKDQLGLGEPKPEGPTEQADKFKAAFQAVAAQINSALRSIAAYVQKVKYDQRGRRPGQHRQKAY